MVRSRSEFIVFLPEDLGVQNGGTLDRYGISEANTPGEAVSRYLHRRLYSRDANLAVAHLNEVHGGVDRFAAAYPVLSPEDTRGLSPALIETMERQAFALDLATIDGHDTIKPGYMQKARDILVAAGKR